MSIVAWKVTKYDTQPERKEFARETEHCYFTKRGRRVAKRNSWETYFANEADAISAIAARNARKEAADAAPELHEEMLRYLPVLERAEADPEVWERLTAGLGIATLNGYRAAIAKATVGSHA